MFILLWRVVVLYKKVKEMELKEATEQDIKNELHLREVEKKKQQIITAVNEINAALTTDKIESIKWENFEGKRSNETKWIVIFFK